jgi:hypothetical protein
VAAAVVRAATAAAAAAAVVTDKEVMGKEELDVVKFKVVKIVSNFNSHPRTKVWTHPRRLFS